MGAGQQAAAQVLINPREASVTDPSPRTVHRTTPCDPALTWRNDLFFRELPNRNYILAN